MQSKFRLLSTGFAVLGVAGLLAGCLPHGVDTTQSVETKLPEVDLATETPNDVEAESKEPIGDSDNDTSDAGKIRRIGLNEPIEVAELTVEVVNVSSRKGNNEWIKPAEGNAYYLVEFKITNNRPDSFQVSSMMLFSGYVNDVSADQAIILDDDVKSLDGELAPGRTMQGHYVMEGPANAKRVGVDFTPDWLDADTIVRLDVKNKKK